MTTTNTTQEFVERVKNFPAIYDRQHPNHSKIKEKELIWMKLSAEFNCDAKRKWNALRDKYVREKKKERTNSMKFVSSWDHFICMNFLESHIKPRSQSENNEIFQPIMKSSINENFDESEEIDVKEFYDDFCKEMASLNDVESTNSVYSTREKVDSDFDLTNSNSNSIRKNILRTLETFREKFNDMSSLEEDEDKVFLKLIANKMKKMTPIEKSNFQMEILKDADEFLYR